MPVTIADCPAEAQMTWIDVAWTAAASASLTLGGVHLFVWFKERTQVARLWFFALSVSVPVFGFIELLAMYASTPAEYVVASRWAQPPLFLIVASMVGFVRSYFGTGRTWLAIATVATRAAALIVNFTSGVSVLHRDVTGLARVELWGGVVVSAPVGTLNPWIVLTVISNALLAAFVIDATMALWRRAGADGRRRATVVGGALLTCIGVAAVMGFFISAGTLRSPTPLTPLFFVVVVAMGYELGLDLLRAVQLSRSLAESERRMDLAAQAAELSFWSWDVRRDRVWTNARGRTQFELDTAGPTTLADLLHRVHPDERESLSTAIREAAAQDKPFERELRLSLPSGNVRWIGLRGQREPDGPAGTVLGVAIDVTVRQRLEREAAQKRSELAHLSRVATLGELSGSLAHEINQPLMGILSNAQAAQRFLAHDSVNLDEVREILADIVEDDKRAGEVIRRLRPLLKKGEVQLETLDVNRLVGDVIRLTRNDLINRDVATNVSLANDLPRVRGDLVQLQQVLLNFIMNACDAMDGQPNPTLLVATRLDDGHCVEVSVKDSGPGVPPADLERIFQPFFTTKDHGTGLGLSVCRTIVNAHGGRIWAQNDPAGGATLRMTLPAMAESK